MQWEKNLIILSECYNKSFKLTLSSKLQKYKYYLLLL